MITKIAKIVSLLYKKRLKSIDNTPKRIITKIVKKTVLNISILTENQFTVNIRESVKKVTNKTVKNSKA